MKPSILEIAAPRMPKIGMKNNPENKLIRSDIPIIEEYLIDDCSNFRLSNSNAPTIDQTHAGSRQINSLIPTNSSPPGETNLAGKTLLKTNSEISILDGTPIQIKREEIGHASPTTLDFKEESCLFDAKSGRDACLIDFGTDRPDKITSQGMLK